MILASEVSQQLLGCGYTPSQLARITPYLSSITSRMDVGIEDGLSRSRLRHCLHLLILSGVRSAPQKSEMFTQPQSQLLTAGLTPSWTSIWRRWTGRPILSVDALLCPSKGSYECVLVDSHDLEMHHKSAHTLLCGEQSGQRCMLLDIQRENVWMPLLKGLKPSKEIRLCLEGSNEVNSLERLDVEPGSADIDHRCWYDSLDPDSVESACLWLLKHLSTSQARTASTSLWIDNIWPLLADKPDLASRLLSRRYTQACASGMNVILFVREHDMCSSRLENTALLLRHATKVYTYDAYDE